MGKIKTVNSISGGKTSAFLAVHHPADYELFSLVCINDLRCKPKDKVLLDYVNTKLYKFIPEFGEFIATAEDDATLYAMMDLEQFLGKEIIWVRGMSFDDVIDKGTQTRLPSWARRYCTEKMKLLPIFLWWFNNIGEKCNMRLGFRFDEFDRMERFFNNSDPTNFKIPVACKTIGNKLQEHKTFNWRNVHFPLVKTGTDKDDVVNYWNKHGYVGEGLFKRKIEWPAISNCVGCFHKKEETLAAMAMLQLPKMQWFSDQESKDMGTWLDNRVTYQHLILNARDIAKEVYYEVKYHGEVCDTGGCTD